MCALGTGNGAVFQIAPQRFRNEIGVVTGLVGMTGGIGGFYLASTLGFAKQATGSYQLGFLGFAAPGLRRPHRPRSASSKQWRSTWLAGLKRKPEPCRLSNAAPELSKEKLVVIGNGMAGCRAVEEILKRDADRYDIVIVRRRAAGELQPHHAVACPRRRKEASRTSSSTAWNGIATTPSRCTRAARSPASIP